MAARVHFEPGSTAVLTAIGVAAVLLAAVWWWRGQPEEVDVSPRPLTADPVPVVSAFPAPTTSISIPTPTGAVSADGVPSGVITVDIRGDVARPGLIELPGGSRVMDAVEAAGGATGRYGPVNLARVLVDGEQVRIGPPAPAARTAVPGAVGSSTAPGGSSETGDLIDINTADVVELEDLDGVGPVLAAAIVQWRTDNGPFTSVDDLLDVSGIGDATLDGMRHQITIG